LILWSVSESIARQPPEIDRDRETKCREEVHRQAGRRTLAIEILQQIAETYDFERAFSAAC
jgi:hypothetical protein